MNMQKKPIRTFRHPYYVYAFVGLGVALLGFSATYFVPIVANGAEFARVLHLHGLFGFAWLVFFIAQSLFVKNRKVSLHRLYGKIGVVVALGVAITMQMAGFYMAEQAFAQGMGAGAYSFLPGPVFDSILFGVLVVGGVLYRRRKGYHGRFMLLATTLILWVAWSRLRHYFPPFDVNETFFGFFLAMAPILFFMLYERFKTGVIHPVMLWGGLFVIVQQGAQVIISSTPIWGKFGEVFYNTLTVFS